MQSLKLLTCSIRRSYQFGQADDIDLLIYKECLCRVANTVWDIAIYVYSYFYALASLDIITNEIINFSMTRDHI